jgi:hypothetical protein
MAVGGNPYANVRLGIRGTQSSADTAFGVYMGGLTLAPANTFNAYFQYAGGGTIDTTAGTVAVGAAMFLGAIAKSGGGTITDMYGIYAEVSTSATNNYGAYIAGPSGFGTTPSLSTNLLVAASAAGKSSMRIPSGTAPSSPVSGDFWYDGTNLKFRDGGTTRTLTWT